ncbi:MAG: S41 family peptidase [Cyanobacteria bacterium J06628_6]
MSDAAADANLESGPGDIDLTPAVRAALLNEMVEALGRYALPEVAAKLQQAICDRTQDGDSTLTSGIQFAATLTAQLQTLSADRHLCVHFSPTPLPQLTPDTEPSPDEIAHQRQQSQQRNFDINRVERLAGNIGYLQLFGFEPPEFAGAAMTAALTLLAHTDALVIDLRQNQGGSPQMVALLCSYLLPAYPPVHLTTLHWPHENRQVQNWTLPYLPGPRYLDRPVYVLISPDMAAAAEEFAYTLQQLKRVVVVGETSAGGANPGRGYRLHDHFWMFIPTGRVVSPITDSNWQGSGVVPNFKVPCELALATGHLLALKHLERHDSGPQREIQAAITTVEKQLNQMQQDLIGQMSGLR